MTGLEATAALLIGFACGALTIGCIVGARILYRRIK